jgi:hypothetical protein
MKVIQITRGDSCSNTLCPGCAARGVWGPASFMNTDALTLSFSQKSEKIARLCGYGAYKSIWHLRYLQRAKGSAFFFYQRRISSSIKRKRGEHVFS